MYKYNNLNQTLIGMCQEILRVGVWRGVRGMDCLEIPYPVIIEISNPTDRYITIHERKWNRYLPFAESLWIALGINDLGVLPARYCKNLYTYSDNGTHWRAGYGPRIRAYSGLGNDVYISDPRYRRIVSGCVAVVDQLKYVIDALNRDINTRQAIIEIGDPVKDDFDDFVTLSLKETKDYPCTRSIQFMMVDGKLNCTVYIRSNDVLYGMSAVNIFNFTWMQEYIANIIGVPIGKYYHCANNLHLYEEQLEKVKEIALLNLEAFENTYVFQYRDKISTLEEFDKLCDHLFNYEQLVYRGECDEFISFGNDMFDDWAKVFMHYHKECSVPPFVNPYLNKLFKK